MGNLSFLFVAIGGAIGAVARYGFSTLINNRRVDGFPAGTMAVNVIGSFIIGFLFTSISPLIGGALLPDSIANARTWVGFLNLLLITGFCGGFTTFSTATIDAVSLARTGRVRQAVSYTLVTLIAALVAVSLGALVGDLVVMLVVPG